MPPKRAIPAKKGAAAKASPIKKPAKSVAGPSAELKKHAAKIVAQLNKDFPDADCALTHQTPFQLLIATILSAQCTDERVNIVCKDLFKKYKQPTDFAAAPIGDIETAVKSTGFYRNKAKNIKACSAELVDKYKGKVPKDLDALVQLAGVGRKTANVVLGTAYGIPTGVVVDTHVGRLSLRMGLTKQTDAVKVEQDLMQLVPQNEWIGFAHRMILHGRQVCNARKPACERCSLQKICPKIGVVIKS
ncbi:MAG: endonuclease III [Bythopirellula sp.]|nr:endonuclease III [Bythopirellula sp.]